MTERKQPGLRRGAVSYDEALVWLAVNGDHSWLHEKHPVPNFGTQCLISWYQHAEADVIKDLRRLVKIKPPAK